MHCENLPRNVLESNLYSQVWRNDFVKNDCRSQKIMSSIPKNHNVHLAKYDCQSQKKKPPWQVVLNVNNSNFYSRMSVISKSKKYQDVSCDIDILFAAWSDCKSHTDH